VLHTLLPLTANGTISQLSILSRKDIPLVTGYQNIDVINTTNFGNYESHTLDKLKGAQACIWALGISANQVSKEEYVKITLDWPLVAAKEFSTLNDHFRFIYVSGEGATTKPGILTPYFGKIKGQAERELIDLSKSTPSLDVISMRPGGIDWAGHPEVAEEMKQRKTSFGTKAVEYIIPVFKAVMPSMLSPTRDLGKFLVDLALKLDWHPKGPGTFEDGAIVSNTGFLRLVKDQTPKSEL